MTQQTVTGWWWKIPSAALGYAAGAMAGGALLGALGYELPRLGEPAAPARALVLLLVAGLGMAVGLAAMAVGMAGTWWQRWLLLTLFAIATAGVGTALEAAIFTTLSGQWTLMPIDVAMGVACALVVAWLFTMRSAADGGATGLSDSFAAFRSQWTVTGLAGRLLLGLLAFPFAYFLFGMIVAPIVTPYYDQIEFLVIPPMTTILTVLFVRSALFLAVSLPIVAAWRRSRGALAIALGLGHFATVGFAGLVQATFLPPVLRWTHGLEILSDSMLYAAILAWLFMRRSGVTERR
jgi:hypothetical protein